MHGHSPHDHSHGHHHHHGHFHGHHHHDHSHILDAAERNLGWAFALNLGFALIELIGGFWAGSLAIMSDALHDFGDALSLGIGLFLQRKSRGRPTEQYSYGLKRLSLFSALLSGLIIITGAAIILLESVPRLWEPTEPNGLAMLMLACFGVVVNGFAAWKLSGGHTHNEKMMRWHLMEDVLGWLTVLVGSLGVLFLQWNWLDPVMAIGVSCFVTYNVIRQLYHTLNVLMQATPNPPGLKAFRESVQKMEGVQGVHDVHFWSLDGLHHVLSMHVVSSSPDPARLKAQIRELSHSLGHCHVTIEIETASEKCADNCESPTS